MPESDFRLTILLDLANLNCFVRFVMYRKIQRVQKILNEAALHTEKYSRTSGVSCASQCHLCCLKKDISASPLEFLPLAYHLYKEGRAEKFYDLLEKLPENSLCIMFSALGNQPGGCTRYDYRGLICRLFGFSSNTDKNGHTRLITCKTIKATEQYQQLKHADMDKSPKFTDYYMQLAAIDFILANEQLQINEAIRRALEIVLTYYMYRNRKRPA